MNDTKTKLGLYMTSRNSYGKTTDFIRSMIASLGPGSEIKVTTVEIEQLEKALRESRAREAKLREALESIRKLTYGTELHDTDAERADNYWIHLSRFQSIAREALKETKP